MGLALQSLQKKRRNEQRGGMEGKICKVLEEITEQRERWSEGGRPCGRPC